MLMKHTHKSSEQEETKELITFHSKILEYYLPFPFSADFMETQIT